MWNVLQSVRFELTQLTNRSNSQRLVSVDSRHRISLLDHSITLHMEQDTGFEPAPSAWKADMLAIEHQSCIQEESRLQLRGINKKLSKRLLLLCRHCCLSSPVGFHHIFCSNLLLNGCGKGTRTTDLQLMGLTSCQLLYPAI